MLFYTLLTIVLNGNQVIFLGKNILKNENILHGAMLILAIREIKLMMNVHLITI